MLLAETQALISYVSPTDTTTIPKGRKTPVKPKSISPAVARLFLDSVRDYLEQGGSQNGGGDAIAQVLQRLDAIEKAQKGQQQQTGQTYATVHQMERNLSSSYAAAASRGAATPVSSASAAPSKPSTTPRATKATEVRVSIRDPEVSKTLSEQPKTAQYIIDKVNTTVKASGIDSDNNGARSTATRWVRAARLLNSGDVVLQTIDAPTAERMVYNSTKWLPTALGIKAKIIVPTYGVIISNVPCKGIDIAKEQGEIIAKIQQQNADIIGEDSIDRVHWLSRSKKGRKENAMVVELKDPAIANACLQDRLVWDGDLKKTERYLKDCQICQCFKCHSYGHTTKSCSAKERCGYCSSKEHTTKAHTNPKDTTKLKCPLCGERHPAWSEQCRHKKKAIERITAAKKEVQANPWFPTIAINITPGVSQRGSRESSNNGVSLPPAKPRKAPSASSPAVEPPTTPTPSFTFAEGAVAFEDRRMEDIADDGFTPVKGSKKRGVRLNKSIESRWHGKRKLFSPYKQHHTMGNTTDFDIPERIFGELTVPLQEAPTVDQMDTDGIQSEAESGKEPSTVGTDSSASDSSSAISTSSQESPEQQSPKQVIA